jgi:hypothetical protein
MKESIFDNLVMGWIMLALLIFPVLLFVTAPYGRHTSRKWGITIPNRQGWVLMEAPALILFSFFFLSGNHAKPLVTWIIFVLFAIHYFNRAFIYPFRIKTRGKRMPLIIALMAVIFNTMNSFINGYYLTRLQKVYGDAWLTDPRFITGVALFLTGMIINMRADTQLIRLRKSTVNGYKIPYGGLFDLISCPNFFGEIIEWLGFALLCWSLPALSFFIWTFCNLVPRALNHHRWYKNHFADYPATRKAVFPYLL